MEQLSVPDAFKQNLESVTGNNKLGGKETELINEGESREKIREETAKESEHRRTESFRKHFGWIIIGALYAMSFGILTFAIVWIWHIIMPAGWRWLKGTR